MIKPIRDQILVKLFPSDNVSEGGILVPDNCKTNSNKAEVIAVGNELHGKPMRFKEGDIIFRVKNWGTPIPYNGAIYYMMSQDSVLAKL